MANVTEDMVLKFLLDRGGKVKHSELLDEFRTLADPEDSVFEKRVKSVADTEDEGGIIYVVLKEGNQPFTRTVPGCPESSEEHISDFVAETGTGGQQAELRGRSNEVVLLSESIPNFTAVHEKVHGSLEHMEMNSEDSRLGHGTEESLSQKQEQIFSDTQARNEKSRQSGEVLRDGNRSLPTVLVEESSPISETPTSAEESNRRDARLANTTMPVQKPCMLPIRCHPVHLPSHVKSQEHPQSGSLDTGNTNVPGGKLDQMDTAEGSLAPPKSPRMRRRQLEEVPSSPFVKRGFKHFTTHYDCQYYDIPLDPVQHQWLVNAASGRWTQLYGMLLKDTHLAGVKDFMSGFTALHWAAKSGDCDALSQIVDAAIKDNAPANVNVRSYGGYTPLHIASIHGHEDVIFKLVRCYNAKIDIRDHSGKKPYQYLTKKASVNVRRLLGDPQSLQISEHMLPKRGSKVTSSFLLSTTSTLLGVMADDSAIHDLATGLNKKPHFKFFTSTAKRKPKVRGTFSSVYEDVEEESVKTLTKPRPVSEIFPGSHLH